MTEAEQRQAVITEARSWLHTPFVHAARIKGAGVDCGQLLVACYRAAGLDVPEPKFYRFQHHLHSHSEDYIAELLLSLKEIPESQAAMGDCVLYKCGRTYSHGAIIVDSFPGTVIHSLVRFGVIYGDSKRDGMLRRPRRFFSIWG